MKCRYVVNCSWISCFTFYNGIGTEQSQMHRTFQHNILQPYCPLLVDIWPPCCNMLVGVGWTLIMYSIWSILLATSLVPLLILILAVSPSFLFGFFEQLLVLISFFFICYLRCVISIICVRQMCETYYRQCCVCVWLGFVIQNSIIDSYW